MCMQVCNACGWCSLSIAYGASCTHQFVMTLKPHPCPSYILRSVADRIAALKTSSTAGYSQSDAFKAAPKVERSTAESASASQPSENLQDRWQRVQSASQSYRRTPSQDPEQNQEESSSSSGSSSESSSSSSESGSSSASPGTIPSLRLPGTLGSTPVVDAGIDNDQWQAAMDRYNQESTEPSAGENEGRFNAAGHLENSAANRQTGDTTSAVVASSPSAHHSTSHQTSSQEDQDLEYAKRLDMMGDQEDMGYGAQEQSTAPGVGGEEDLSTQEITDKLSLWGTFVVLYKRKPMMKYHLLALLVLLIAAAAIIGISVSSKNKDSSSNQDCSSASYVNEPKLLLPSEGIPAGPGLTVSAGGFGTDVSASSDYLVVGAPNPTSTCTAPDQTACAYTIGGGAYLYRRSGNTGWKLYSSFILDDGISKGDEFGKAVGISEDSTTMVVGAPEDDGLGIVAGAVYVMETPFSETEAPIKLMSDDIGPNDNFGGSVSVSTAQLSGGVKVTNVIVGAQHDDDFGSKSGAVYVFSKFDGQPRKNACGGDITIDPGKFIQCQKLLPDDGETNDLFGRVVNVAGKTLVVGAMWDDDRGIDSGELPIVTGDVCRSKAFTFCAVY